MYDRIDRESYLARMFGHQEPTDEQRERCVRVRTAYRALANVLLDETEYDALPPELRCLEQLMRGSLKTILKSKERKEIPQVVYTEPGVR